MHGVKIKVWPALSVSGKQVSLRVYNSSEQAQQHHYQGLRQLFINSLTDQVKHLRRNLTDINKLCLHYADFGDCESLKKDLINACIDELFTSQDISSYKDFLSILNTGKSELFDFSDKLCLLLNSILTNYKSIKKILKNPPLEWLDTVTDIKLQLDALLFPGFLTEINPDWLKQYPRYLSAISRRLEKIAGNPVKDRESRLKISNLWHDYIERSNKINNQHGHSDQLDHYRWMLEEYRVSLFSQELKTLFPVSEKRLKKYWDGISDI